MSVRSGLKAVAEAGLARSGIAILPRLALSRQSLVLAYHNVVPDGCPPFGDRSLHLPHRMFVRQLDHVLRTYSVVPLEDMLARPPAGGRRPRVAITFDDGYRGAVTLAVDELAKRGVPATLFVAPAFVGGNTFWWDAVTSSDGRSLDGELREHALQELRGEDQAVRQWAQERGFRIQAAPDYARAASEDELQRAVRHPGITLGSHTWSHSNLARLTVAELRSELARPLAWLRRRFTAVIPWLSYPYGIAVRAVEATLLAAGYRGALALGRGWFSPDRVNPWALPRVNVPAGLSFNGFVLRSSGLLYAPHGQGGAGHGGLP
jgi:peptidoglycan/xylan/chitin deacetylase (PgdA/CDA1 family)